MWTHHTFKTAFVALMLSCACSVVSFAGFSTNWPAWQYQREGWSQSTQCLAALNERLLAFKSVPIYTNIQYTNVSVTNVYRSNRMLLMGVKERLRFMIDSQYIVPAYFNPSVATNAIQLDYYSNVVRVCNDCGLPTNFFDYTPYRDLNGLGPYTEDETVGHPYGDTNFFTTNFRGGTNFPGTRTRWYTTDYGWDGVKSVLNTTRQWRADITAGFNRYVGSYDVSRQSSSEILSFPDNTNNGFDGGALFRTLSTSQWVERAIVTNGHILTVNYGLGFHYVAYADFTWQTNTGLGYTNDRFRGTQIRQDRTLIVTNLPTSTNLYRENFVQIWQWATFKIPPNLAHTNWDFFGITGASPDTPGITNRMIPFGVTDIHNVTTTNLTTIGFNDFTEVYDAAGWAPPMYSTARPPYPTLELGSSKSVAAGIMDATILLLFKWDFEY